MSHVFRSDGASDAVAPARSAPGEDEAGRTPRRAAGPGASTMLVPMVGMLLTFNILARTLQHLSERQAIEELLYPTALGVLTIHGRSILIAVGRHLLAGFTRGPGPR